MKKTNPFQRIISTIVILTFVFSNLPVYAQASLLTKPLNTGFLFDIAQKLVDRGETHEAQSVLQKILKSDPDNASVKRLLKNLEEQKNAKTPVVFKTTKPSDIASDIIYIQKNVVILEKRNRELEFTIRKTLQENVFLYQTLSRRNHELLELRKKFFGYDGKTGETLQSTENTDEILRNYEKQIVERDRAFLKRSQEIGQVMKDAGKIGDLLKANQESALLIDSSDNVLEWKNDLSEKRTYLVEKALTLYEKSKDLSQLHAEVSSISKSLKEANDNYGETVEEYEVKIQKLNNVWVQDKARQQSEIDRLKVQIKNEKVKNLASKLTPVKEDTEKKSDPKSNLKTAKQNKVSDPSEKVAADKKETKKDQKEIKSSATKEVSVLPKSEEIKLAKSEEVAKKEKSLLEVRSNKDADFQAEIKRLEAALAQKEKELNDRSLMFDSKIRELKTSWANEKSAQQQSKLFNRSGEPIDPEDEEAVKSSDVYKDVIQELDYIKDQLNMRESELSKFHNEMTDHTTQLDELQAKLASRESRLAQMDELIVTKDQQIEALKKELVLKVTEIKQKNLLIGELQAKLAEPQTVIKDMNKRVVVMKNTDDIKKQPVEELKDLVAELESQLGTDPKTKAPAEDLKQQLTESLNLIQQKDKEIQALKAKLDDDKKLNEFRSLNADKKKLDDQVRNYQNDVESLKKQLADAVKQRKEAEKNWDDASKKLVTMAEELKKSQAGSASSAQRINEYIKKVEDLNGQLKEQSSNFSAQLQSLKDKIAQKDEEIAGLKNQLADKDRQVQQFYESLEKATQKLNSKSNLRLDQKPTDSAISDLETRPGKKSDAPKVKDSKWDPANNDAFALQQRLDTLSKELKFTQDQLADRTKEAGELNKKLKEKKVQPVPEVAAKKVDNADQLSKLQKELDLIKQQSDLTKTTIKIQQDKLSRSQKDVSLKEKTLKTIVDQLNKMRRQVDDYKSTIKEKDEQISLQKKALEHETKKNDTLNKKLRDITETIGADTEFDGVKGKASAAGLKSSLKTYEIRERDFKKQINDIQEQLKASYVMIEDGEARIKNLKQRLSVREERISELEKELQRQVKEQGAESGSTAAIDSK